MKIRPLVAFILFYLTAGANAQQRPTDPLNSATQCFSSGEFHYKDLDRLPVTVKSRTINLATGPVQVSTADGYRLMIYRSSVAPLVNLKIERSAEGQFAADRTALIAQLTEGAGSVKPEKLNVETTTQNGIEVVAVSFPSIEKAPGIIGVVLLMDAKSGTVATANILNQQKKNREFANDAEYLAMRDRFINTLSACIARTQQ